MPKNHSISCLMCLSLFFACHSPKNTSTEQDTNINKDSVAIKIDKIRPLINVQKFEYAKLIFNKNNLQILPGNQQVYELSFNKAGSNPETDQGFTEKLVFQTPMKVTHYDLNEDNFKNNTVFWARLCKCDDSGYMPITSGSITLVNGDSLNIEFDISYTGHSTNKEYNQSQKISFGGADLNIRSLKKGQEYEAYKGKVLSNKSLDNTGQGNIRIIEGDKYVIAFSRQTGPNPKTDMGFYEKVIIEVSDLNHAFSLDGEEIKNANAYYGRLCRCMNSGYNKLIGGSISAKPESHSKWSFNISVSALGRHDSTIYPINISTEIEINPNDINIKQALIIDNVQYKSYSQDPFELLETNIESGKIRCKVRYSGGCQGANFKLLSSDLSDQKRIKLRLGFEDKDHCRSIVTKNLFFDLEPLRKTSLKGPVELIINDTHSLSYVIN